LTVPSKVNVHEAKQKVDDADYAHLPRTDQASLGPVSGREVPRSTYEVITTTKKLPDGTEVVMERRYADGRLYEGE
jgi:hypothetical protein